MKKRLIGLVLALMLIVSSSIVAYACLGDDPDLGELPFEPFSICIVIEYEPLVTPCIFVNF